MASDTILTVLQHSLGVDQYGRGNQYRDHFVCGEGHDSYAACCAAVAQGLMTRRESALFGDNGSLFRVTDAGRAWMAANSPAPPKLTRSQQRYQRYLDADTSLTFREWLDYDRPEPSTAHCRAVAMMAALDPSEIPF
ncbi:hypothetical protein ASE70_14905 [Sphingomonas sp. Leaf22]|uniref:hypothetical protein n=1 Tax=Sphingomonas sp. Leaf22 TaxID=1735687 RepID=UPI0006FF17B5|nr:hypothetical protein [Sphingomonas sp. Leaf22]KQM92264.1 hypothetical protein ASE70_14905 [Sphingomonas sp. Leaf22]